VAIATVIAGLAQLAVVWWALRRAGFVPRLALPRLDPEVRRFWVLAVPAVLTGGITQINIFIGTIIASGAASAISYLYYADRLYQLPLGIIGIAIGTVLLPELARHLKGGREAEAHASQEQSLLISMLLSMPAATALAALAVPIVRVLFERGAFDAVATVESANALIGFAIGLPAFVLIRVLQPGYFAREDTLTPTLFAAASAAVNIGLSLALFPSLEHVGIALATSISAWLNAVLLAAFLARRGHLALSGAEWRRHAMILLVSLVMGIALYVLGQRASGIFASGGNIALQALVLAILVGFGLWTYFTLVHVTRVQPLGLMLRRIRRGA
jgi:putative peptidoglycan lipid II flippase